MDGEKMELHALAVQISDTFKRFDEARAGQLDEVKNLEERVFGGSLPEPRRGKKLYLPDAWEQFQTMKAHLIDVIYSHPEGLFDVFAKNSEDAELALAHKGMLIDIFEKTELRNEIEKIVNNLIMTGETTIFVGWDTKFRNARVWSDYLEDFEVKSYVDYDGVKVKTIAAQDFVFDTSRADKWESCPKIYRCYLELSEIKEIYDKKYLTKEVQNALFEGVMASREGKEVNGFKNGLVELLEYWGDIRTSDGKLLKNQLITVAMGEFVVRFEENPYINTPFIYANLIENPVTKRGISPIKPVLALNSISSEILNKQLEAYSLVVNPPYLAPKGAFKGEQVVSPGKIIEYDSSLLPQMPTPINFSGALSGWDFIQYFKNSIESATGIFRTMSGIQGQNNKTATETMQSAHGQNARINLIIDGINRKIILPLVKKVAETISNFDMNEYMLEIPVNGKKKCFLIDDKVKCGNFKYRYSDRKATIERKYRYKELCDSIVSFSKIPEVSSKIDWRECFKFAIEQLGIENSSKFLKEEDFDELSENNYEK